MRQLVRKHLRHLGIRCDGGLPNRIRRIAIQRAVAAAGLTMASCHSRLCRRRLRQAAVALFASFASLRTCVQGTRLAPPVAVELEVLQSLWCLCHEDGDYDLVYAELAAPVLSALHHIANSPLYWPRQTRAVRKLLRANSLAQGQVHKAVTAASTALVCHRTASRYTEAAASAAEKHTAALRMAMTADDYCKVAAGCREIGDTLFGGRDLLCFDPTALVAASTRMRNTRRGPFFRCLTCDGEEGCEVAVGPCPRGMLLCRKYMHMHTHRPPSHRSRSIHHPVTCALRNRSTGAGCPCRCTETEQAHANYCCFAAAASEERGEVIDVSNDGD